MATVQEPFLGGKLCLNSPSDAEDSKTPMQPVPAPTMTISLPVESNENEKENVAVPSRYDVRVAMVGNVDAGKSTLTGVLVSGLLDDGRGFARAKIFQYGHELETGRTSSIGLHILGFERVTGKPVHQTAAATSAHSQKTKAWQACVEASSRTITFVDLAGHEGYLKTTILGLTGLYVDAACVVVGGNMGVSQMTKEHMGVCVALGIPVFVVVTKIDLAPQTVLCETVKTLFKILKCPAARKLPVIVKKMEDVDLCAKNLSDRICPIFLVSNLKGTNINLLTSFLSKLKPRPSARVREHQTELCGGDPTHAELDIDQIFNVSGVGLVVCGTVLSGEIRVNDTFQLGPFSDASWKTVTVRSIEMKRVGVSVARTGDACTCAVRAVRRKDILSRSLLRRGMVMIRHNPVYPCPTSLADIAPNPAAPATVPFGQSSARSSSSSSSTISPARLELSAQQIADWTPFACYGFEAEVLVLQHHTSICPGYQPVAHTGNVRQSVVILSMSQEILRTGDKAVVVFKFLYRPEFIRLGSTLLFRDGRTKGVGKITRLLAAGDPALTVSTRRAAEKAKKPRDGSEKEQKQKGPKKESKEQKEESKQTQPNAIVPPTATAPVRRADAESKQPEAAEAEADVLFCREAESVAPKSQQ